MTPAERNREKRRRDREGLMQLRIEVHDTDWPELLISLGRLRRGQEDDRAAIAAATSKLIADVKAIDIFPEPVTT